MTEDDAVPEGGATRIGRGADHRMPTTSHEEGRSPVSEDPTTPGIQTDIEAETEQQQTVAEVQAHLADAVLGLQKLGADAGTTGLLAASCSSCQLNSCQ